MPDSKTSACEDCPPVGYPTDKTRCLPCPRRMVKAAQDTDFHFFAMIEAGYTVGADGHYVLREAS